MLRLIIAIISILAATYVEAKSTRFYDSRGMYAGRVSSQGNIYDRNGKYSGRMR